MDVTITSFQHTKIEFIINDVAEGIFECSRLDLICKPKRYHLGLVVIVVFEACHPLHHEG